MRIVVNDIAASKGGAMTVLKDFYQCVCENDKENQWIFLLSDKFFDETENVKIITLPKIKNNPFKKVLFDFFTGKNYINKLNPDIVFSMQNIMTFGVKAPQIVYLHQSIPFQKVKRFSFLKKNERKLAFIQYFIGAVLKLTVKKCRKVIVQTKWMKEAVCEICRVDADKVYQIPPNVKNISHLRKDDLFDSKKFFYPTAPALYKNNECIFKASEILKGEGITFNTVLTLPENRSKENINCVGRIPYEEVIDYYNQTTLIFPSYIETFGYPLTEARKMGAIVLASDCAFSREALENYENAYFFNPFKEKELAELMKKVISGEIVRKKTADLTADTEDNWKKILDRVLRLSK